MKVHKNSNSRISSVRVMPLSLFDSYGEVIQSLPQGVMLDVWKKFAASLKSHFVDPTTKQDTGLYEILFQIVTS